MSPAPGPRPRPVDSAAAVRFPLHAALLASVLAFRPGGAAADPPAPVAQLTGMARGISVTMDPFFQWKPNDAQSGVLGTLQGVTKEFESIGIEVGADRSLFTAAQRVAYEAYRVKTEIERGEYQVAEVKADLSVVRVKTRDVVYACAAKQVGRTPVSFRAWGPLKHEAALVKLVTGAAARTKSEADEVNGWIPEEVKTAWTRTQDGDVIVVHDGAVAEPVRAAVVKAVHDAHAVVKRLLAASWSTPFPPVVRITASRDLVSHVSGRRDLADVDAVYVPWAGELLVSPRHANEVDVATVAPAAALQAVHHVLGAVGGEPIQTGLLRQALAAALGAEPGALLPTDEAQAIDRVKTKQAQTWSRILRLPSVARAFAKPEGEQAIDAELSTVFATDSGGPQAKAGFAAWIGAFRKVGHPDAAAEAACGAMDPKKADEEFWAWWTVRVEPPPKPKPGEKPAPGKPPPTKPPPVKPPVKPPPKPK